MAKPGPKPKEIDWELIAYLASIHCTQEEIAGAVKLSVDSLYNRAPDEVGESLSDYIKRNAFSGKASLRRMQWKAAQDGNVSMLIWLGKQFLGQKDKSAEEIAAYQNANAQALTKEQVIEITKAVRLGA